MSVSNRERRKAFFALSSGSGVYILVLILLVSGFAPIGVELMSAFAQEENNTARREPTSNIATTSSGIELSAQPIYQQQARTISEIPIIRHISALHSPEVAH